MNTTPQSPTTTWLKTNDPVAPVSPACWSQRLELESALRRGVTATTDPNRPGFYEIEIGNNWYYVHFPTRIKGVFLVACRPTPAHLAAGKTVGVAVSA